MRQVSTDQERLKIEKNRKHGGTRRKGDTKFKTL